MVLGRLTTRDEIRPRKIIFLKTTGIKDAGEVIGRKTRTYDCVDTFYSNFVVVVTINACELERNASRRCSAGATKGRN